MKNRHLLHYCCLEAAEAVGAAVEEKACRPRSLSLPFLDSRQPHKKNKKNYPDGIFGRHIPYIWWIQHGFSILFLIFTPRLHTPVIYFFVINPFPFVMQLNRAPPEIP